MATYQEQLASIDAQIRANNAAAATLRISASEWEADGNDDKIRVTHKAADTAEKNRKLQIAADRRAEASVKENENSILIVSKKSIQAMIDAEATSQVALAQQGKDSSSLRIEATGNANAAKIAAENISAAQARSIDISASTDADGKKKEKNVQLFIIIAVSAVGLGIGGFILYKKFKKKKK